MTGNTLTMNPMTGPNALNTNPFGATPQGFWGNVSGFNTPFSTPSGFGTQAFQPQVTNPINPISSIPGFNPTAIQQPGVFGQVGSQTSPQVGQAILAAVLQTTPPQVVNAILQTTPPQVLPYILNALACQQVCQQVLAQNPQALQALQAQTIGQPFGQTAPGQTGFSTFGTNVTPFGGGFQPQGVPPFLQQGAGVGCAPGLQQLLPTSAFGQAPQQQPWFSPTFGTW